MKDQLYFTKVAKDNLRDIEKEINQDYLALFYHKLSSNLCTLLRESKLPYNVSHRIKFEEKTIPNISLVEINLNIKATNSTMICINILSISVK